MNPDNTVPPIKPNQPSQMSGFGRTRPTGAPKSDSNFDSYLDSTGEVAKDETVTESMDRPNLFNLTKKRIMRDALLAQPQSDGEVADRAQSGKIKFQTPDDQTAVEIPTDQMPVKKPKDQTKVPIKTVDDSIATNTPSTITRPKYTPIRKSDVANQNNGVEEDDDLDLEAFPEEIAAGGNEALAQARSLFNLKNAQEEFAMGKRFEVPTHPISPSEDDMMAQAKIQTQADIAAFRQLKDAFENKSLIASNLKSSETLLASASDSLTEKKALQFAADERALAQNVQQAPIAPVAPTFAQTDAATSQSGTSSQTLLSELMKKIVEGIQTIKKEGVTETVVTLRGPILDGAKLTLTSFDSAHNEFNITFSDLTQPAKEFLDNKMTKNSLTDNLESQGYTIHILTTTTLTENNFNADPGRFAREQQEEQQKQQHQQEQQKQPRFFEEEEEV